MPAARSHRAILLARRTLAWVSLPLWGWAFVALRPHVPPHGDGMDVLLTAAAIASVAALHEINAVLHETARDRDKDVLLRTLADAAIRRAGKAQTGPMRRAAGRHEASAQPRLSLLPAQREKDQHAG